MQDFTRASALAGFGELARSTGLNPEDMLIAANLPNDILDNADGMISYRSFLSLLDISTRRSNDPLFGLKLGLLQGASIFGPLIYLIRNANTIGDALNEFRQYFHLHMGAAELDIQHHGTMVQLSYKVLDPLQTGLKQGTELALGVGLQLLRTLLGRHWQAQAIIFEHQAQGPLKEYCRLLGQTPQFNSDSNALLFDASLLNTPLCDADPELHTLIRAHLDSMQKLSNQELPAYIESLLRNMLANGRVTVDQVAKCMAMSRRTLQRRLTELDTSFQVILDKTRQGLASRYLRDSSLQVTQLADLLGYADLSAFSRAFSRWYGMPPSKWKWKNHH